MASKEELARYVLPEIELRIGPIIQKDVDVLVNSANGTLIHGSGTAADISRASGQLSEAELGEYATVVAQISGIPGRVYREVWELAQKGEYSKPTKLQLECARFFVQSGRLLQPGDIAVTSSGDLANSGGARWIIHAVGMTYDYAVVESGRPPVIPAETAKIREAVLKALNLVREINLGKSVAIPLMCVRKGGVTPEQSCQGILEAISRHIMMPGTKQLQRIVMVADNPVTANFASSLPAGRINQSVT